MRLDALLVENGFFDSRTKAKECIERGEVYFLNKPVLKASFSIELFDKDKIEIKKAKDFVSLGGYKLDKAINDFMFNPSNLTCIDLGSSTGGFTDCLIQNNAKKVYAIDVNISILHDKIKNNSCVIPLEKNARDISKQDFSENIDLVVCDLSFISSSYVLPSIYNVLNDNKHVILLITPQFEMNKRYHAKNGVIRDLKVVKSVCKNVYDNAILNGFTPLKITSAPINQNKNREYLMLLEKNGDKMFNFDKINFENL